MLTSAERQRAYYQRHRERVLARDRAYRLANPEKRRALWQRYYAVHGERLRARSREYAATHQDEIRAQRRLRQRDARVRRQKSQRQSIRQYRERGAPGNHTLQEWQDKCALLGGVCFYCGESRPLTRDHKVPISRGGSNDITNILPACVSCNSAKKDRTAQEFIAPPQRRAA